MTYPVRLVVGFAPRGFDACGPLPRLVVVRRQLALTERLVAHELQHVLQAERHRPWPLTYVLAWLRAGLRYNRVSFGVEARAAERDPAMLAWARDVIAAHRRQRKAV